MQFGVLGPLAVKGGSTNSEPSAPKERQALALLMINANRTVPVQGMIDELWDYRPPARAVAAVHTYIKQLRSLLRERPPDRAGPPAPERLVTRGRGYRLNAGTGEFDVDVFNAEVKSARCALARGDHARAAARFRAALGIWRGRVLVDVTRGPLLGATADELDATRLSVISERIDADLRLGHHHRLIAELTALTRQNPANEDFAAHLMIALYRSGRQADALEVFHRLRRALNEAFSAVPSPRVRELNSAMLAADPRLEWTPGGRPGLSIDLAASAPLSIPAQPGPQSRNGGEARWDGPPQAPGVAGLA